MEHLAEGVRLLVQGRPDEARSTYLRIWHEASDVGDDYSAGAAAHLLGVMVPMPGDEKLTWHLESLACANRVQDGRVDEWYASIYVNLGLVYRLLDHPTEALVAYQEADHRTHALSEPSYAEALRASIAQALTELKAPTDRVNSSKEPSLVPPRPPAGRSAP